MNATTHASGARDAAAGRPAGRGVSTLRLMRLDPALNRWYIGTAVAAGVGSLFHLIPDLAGRLQWVPAGRSGPFEAFFLLALWFFFLVVVMANATTHSTRLSLGLPIATRKVWSARILSVLLVSCAPVAAMTVVVGSRWPEGGVFLSFETGMLRAGFHAIAAVILAVFLLQAPNLSLARQRRRADYVVYAVFMGLLLTVIAVPTVGMVPVAAALLLIAAVIALRTWVSLPPSFVTHPAEPEGASPSGTTGSPAPVATAARTPEERRAPSAGHRFLALARIIDNHWGNWINTLLLGFYVTLLIASYHNGEMDNPFALFIFIWVFASMQYGIQRLVAVDHLPISRRTLFAVVFAPSLAGAVLGIGGGILWTAAGHENARLVFYHHGSVDYPNEFLRISTDGPPQVLTSPWGETHAPKSVPIWRGSSIYVYKPYDSGPDSSPRFVRLQIDRALEAVNGLEPERLAARDDPAPEEPIDCCARIPASIGKGSETRSRAWAVGGIAAFLFFSVVLYVQFRFGGRVGKWNPLGYLVPLVMVGILFVIGLVVAAGRLGFCEPWALEAVPAIACRRAAQALPLPTALLWLAAAAAGAAGIVSIGRAFARIEAPLARKQPFLKEY